MTPGKDILETLAMLEFHAEMGAHDEDDMSSAQAVTTFRRVCREAGYDLPVDFDWQTYLPE